jgi:hypothetical protein
VSAFARGLRARLFYVQHQFEGVSRARGKECDYSNAALQGASLYKLSTIL